MNARIKASETVTDVNLILTRGDSHGVKCFFINPMVNGGGSGAVLGGSSSHVQLFTISEFSDEALLVAIDKVKPMMVSLFPSQVSPL